MPSEMTARAGPLPDASSERNYQAFYGALAASARGRDFLAEYARRNRKADGEKLLAAIDRLQSLLPGTAAGQAETVKRELRSLLVEINAIQAELDASLLAIKAAKFHGTRHARRTAHFKHPDFAGRAADSKSRHCAHLGTGP
jgi:hypothetical protein